MRYLRRYTIPIAGYQITLNDDPYLRISLTFFCSGCKFKCKGCQQPNLQNPKNGKITKLREIKDIIDGHYKLIECVCFGGGDWYFYPYQLQQISKYCKENNLITILYTGARYEDIKTSIIDYLDIVIEGRYIESMKQSIFPASKNQRVFVNGKIVDNMTLPVNIAG